MSQFNPRHRNTPQGQITIAFYRITQAIDSLLRQKGKAMHLSPAQIQTLLFLKYARTGVRTIGGLAGRLGVTYATSSGVADALEAKRLIKRIPLPEDLRIITLRLTPQGESKAELLGAAQAIVRRLQSAGYVRVYEMCWGCQFFRKDAHPNDPRGRHHCAFMDAPLSEPDSYLECPDFVSADN